MVENRKLLAGDLCCRTLLEHWYRNVVEILFSK